MAWDVMILMQAKVGQGTLEGLGPDDQDVGDWPVFQGSNLSNRYEDDRWDWVKIKDSLFKGTVTWDGFLA